MVAPLDPGGLGAGEHDVRLGPARPRWALLVVAAIIAAVGASVVFGDRQRGASPAATTEPVPTSATSLATTSASTVLAPSTTSSSSSEAPTTLPRVSFARSTGLVLYLTPASGAPTGIVGYDVDSGATHEVDLGVDVGWYLRAIDGAGGLIVDGGTVMVVSNGSARILDDSGNTGFDDAPNGRVAPGPRGGVWVRGFDPPAIELVDATGARTGRRYDLPSGAELFGSMADGRPVVRGEDRHVVVIEPDGTRRPLADNAQAPVEAGRFVEARCDLEQRCTALAHVDDRTVDLGPTRADSGVERHFRLQPDGPVVAVSEDDRLSLVDTGTGERYRDVVTDVATGWFGDDRVNARFLPEGLGLVAQTNRGLVFVDLTGHTIARIPIEVTNMPGNPLLGVGRSRFWQP